MLFKDVIRSKRDGAALTDQQIAAFVDGLADETLPAEQVSALAMAIFLNGMNFEETAALTGAMASSGVMLDWSGEDLAGPVVDKHSTGGVGDKVSFVLAPILAACGCYVPMISGRGLGHTGGTTDKVESIPGYVSVPDLATFRHVVASAGCAIIGQTADIAPADRRLYAIRDVTGTVESVPLITASILSKKLAAGLGYLVMDVKVGNGAFMATPRAAAELARSIVETARLSGLGTRAVLTDMNEVLGDSAGNALEIAEAMAYLCCERREERLDAVVLALCGELLVASGVATDTKAARKRCERALTSGDAAEAFGRMCRALGGPADFVTRYRDYLPQAPVVRPVRADGFLASVDTRAVGNIVIELGGGRRELGDKLDLSVGFSAFANTGDRLDDERPLAVVHAATEADASRAASALLAACTIDDECPARREVILETIRED